MALKQSLLLCIFGYFKKAGTRDFSFLLNGKSGTAQYTIFPTKIRHQ
jgi:hypothetical protein